MDLVIERCSDCGRNIPRCETAFIQGETVICSHCHLKRQLGLAHVEFCTDCGRLIGQMETHWLSGGLVVCESCYQIVQLRSELTAIPTREVKDESNVEMDVPWQPSFLYRAATDMVVATKATIGMVNTQEILDLASLPLALSAAAKLTDTWLAIKEM